MPARPRAGPAQNLSLRNAAPDREADLAALLLQIRETQADIRYLPVYLEGAADRHVRSRAEELSERAKRLPNQIARVTDQLHSVPAVIEPTAVEVLATVYRDLRRRRPKAVKRVEQPTLL